MNNKLQKFRRQKKITRRVINQMNWYKNVNPIQIK